MPAAISNGEVILIVVLAAIPVAAIAFAGAGSVYRQIGRGAFSIDHDLTAGGLTDSSAGSASSQDREAEIRQMLAAKAYRQRARGERPVDVEAELDRLLRPSPPAGVDPRLAEEVRQLVVARNERRERRGERPLDVEAEVARQLGELENLGQ